MKNLRHPNIVLWMGVQHDTEKGELSIVTEFVPNGNRNCYACVGGVCLMLRACAVERVRWFQAWHHL
jgi:PP-loop superfamily ATP-utilizing enzyme